MTGAAFDLHLPAVAIVQSMAARAGILHLVGARFFVAGGALQHRVSFNQVEARICMIEYAVGPPCRTMTVGTGGAVPALVIVVGAMAVDTPVLEIVLVVFARVTVAAGKICVTVAQRKPGLPEVIEAHVLPGRGGVAVLAGGSLVAVMHIVNRVAAVARPWRILVTVIPVTVRATGLHVRTGQRVSRGRVIEFSVLPPLV